MKKRLLTLLPYAIVLAADHYLLPCLMSDTGIAMVLMLCVMPSITLICSLVYGVRHGFDFLLPGMAMILFIPTIFIFYNETAWGYVILYGILSIAGIGIGRFFCKKR